MNLRDLGFNWNEISTMLLDSHRTVYRWIHELNISHVTGYSRISDQELQGIIEDFKVQHGPTTGRSIILGHSENVGKRAQKQKVEKALTKTDPLN